MSDEPPMVAPAPKRRKKSNFITGEAVAEVEETLPLEPEVAAVEPAPLEETVLPPPPKKKRRICAAFRVPRLTPK